LAVPKENCIFAVEMKYVARNGREFDDLKLLNQYEMALDTDPNTIGYVVRMLRRQRLSLCTIFNILNIYLA